MQSYLYVNAIIDICQMLCYRWCYLYAPYWIIVHFKTHFSFINMAAIIILVQPGSFKAGVSKHICQRAT